MHGKTTIKIDLNVFTFSESEQFNTFGCRTSRNKLLHRVLMNAAKYELKYNEMLNLKVYVYINIFIYRAQGMNMQIKMLVYIVELCSSDFCTWWERVKLNGGSRG
jgi:hypothetical protein